MQPASRLEGGRTKRRSRQAGYLMTEVLVYISIVFVLLGVGYAAMYRCVDHSLVLRRNADDISRALHAGERWRADVRGATRSIRLEQADSEQILHLEGVPSQVDYRFTTGGLDRRSGSGPWVRVLDNVKASAMLSEPRDQVTVWRWELELQPRAKASVKPSRVRPLFTFLAVPQTTATP